MTKEDKSFIKKYALILLGIYFVWGVILYEVVTFIMMRDIP